MSTTREQDSTTRWSRSLRASQARRAAAARMRRWSMRRRVTATTMVVAALGFGGVAAAQETVGSGGSKQTQSPSQSADAIRQVQTKIGVTADGVVGPQTRKALRTWQRSAGVAVDGVIGSETLQEMGISASPSAASRSSDKPAGTTSSALQRIAQCESGGDPTAISPDGQYRGKYQFDRGTWAANGGTGDPAAAPEATQDAIAAKLLAARGTAPWPVCGQ